MTLLSPFDFSHERCLVEARQLQTFLGAHTDLKERDEILPSSRPESTSPRFSA
jgi:hypothetical protein